MIQQGQPDPTGTNQKVWLSADRDIAVMFPSYVARALRLTASEISKSDRSLAERELLMAGLSRLAETLAAFTNGSSGDGAADTVHALGDRVGLLPQAGPRDDARAMFNEQLMRVLASAYFYGVRMSLHAGERAVNREDLALAVKDVLGVV